MTDVPNYAAKYAAEAARVDFLRDEAKDLKVRWDKGMNYFSSFFAELERLRPQIGDDKLNDWCFWNMGVGLKTIMGTAKILQDEDARRVRDEMKIASEIAKAKAAQERSALAAEKAAKLAAEELARHQCEAKEQYQRNLTAARLLSRNSKITQELVDVIKGRFLRQEHLHMRELMIRFNISDKAYKMAVERARGELLAARGFAPDEEDPPPTKLRKPRRRDSRDTLVVMSGTAVAAAPACSTSSAVRSSISDDDLAAGMHADLDRLNRGRQQAENGRQEWIEGSLGLADKLRRAKEIYPSTAEFSRWLSDHDCGEEVLPHHARAALIKMGHHLTAARDALERVPSWSWEVIWRNELGHLTNVRKSAFDEELSAPAVIH